MNISVVYDNYSTDSRLRSGWGFSCLIGNDILFDCGEKAGPLLANLSAMDIDIRSIRSVVISHDHRDHTGGLWELLKLNRDITVYSCPGFSETFKRKAGESSASFIENSRFHHISPRVAITGEIPGTYKGKNMPEQALVIEEPRGLSVITGCSHPGIVTILKKVQDSFPNKPVNFIMGGFHLKNHNENEITDIVSIIKSTGVKFIGPTHCTGKKAQEIFRKQFSDKYIELGSGTKIELNCINFIKF